MRGLWVCVQWYTVYLLQHSQKLASAALRCAAMRWGTAGSFSVAIAHLCIIKNWFGDAAAVS
jgi:hypothetical protein